MTSSNLVACTTGKSAGLFRALALFGRRLPERVVRSSFPASENLHRSGREQMQQIAPLFDHLVSGQFRR
jgi:hypothetical protein